MIELLKIPFAFLNIQSDLLNIQSDWLYALASFAGGGALGGLISSIINRNENKRIKMSEAAQAEASAKREDAMAATEMMGLLERTVAHMEKMNSYNKSNSEELLKLLKEKEGINEKLKKDIALLQLQISDDHRRITGLEKTVEREIRWRKDGDDHYCMVDNCVNRIPPRGTFKRVEE